MMLNDTRAAQGFATTTTHNGPVCPTCRRGYIGDHRCSAADLRALIAALQAKLDEVEPKCGYCRMPPHGSSCLPG
jgi:hypothetical protein